MMIRERERERERGRDREAESHGARSVNDGSRGERGGQAAGGSCPPPCRATAPARAWTVRNPCCCADTTCLRLTRKRECEPLCRSRPTSPRPTQSWKRSRCVLSLFLSFHSAPRSPPLPKKKIFEQQSSFFTRQAFALYYMPNLVNV
jgi:hypothetical protein